MKSKHCDFCKQDTMHYKDPCVKSGKRDGGSLPPFMKDFFDKPPKK